jgi:RNA polymerase sigma-70 factor (ECF subfamily)
MPLDRRAQHSSGSTDVAGRLAAGGGTPSAPHRSPATDPDRWLTDHGDLMWRYAIVRLRNADAAEEAIQEALVAALEARAHFRGESSERTWLMSILRHKIADRLRRRREAALERGAPVGMFNDQGKWRVRPRNWPKDPHRVMADPEFWRDLENCLAELPPGVGDAFVLYVMRRIDGPAVCAALSIAAGNLWVRLHRARMLLRRCLAGKWAPDQEEAC